MPPEVLILTSFRQRVVVAVVVAVVRQQVVAVVEQVAVVVVRQQVVAVVEQVAVVVVRQQVVAVVQQAFAGKTLPTELCLPLQVAIASSFYLPPKKFCS